MNDKSQISLKNTKEQILAAYNEALELVKKKSQETPAQLQTKQEKQKQVDEVKSTGYEQIVNQLGELKASCTNSIDEFMQTIGREFERFNKLEAAINLEQQHLDSLYSIKTESDTLSAIMLAHQKEKDDFKSKMLDDEIAGRNKLSQLENDYKEHKAELDKQRKREEEEYTYNLNQTRKIDKDKYEQQKQIALQEITLKKQELDTREKELATKEQEFISLQQRVTNLEQEINVRVAEAEAVTTKTLQTEFKYTQALTEEQNKRNVELLQQKIELLEQKNTEQAKVVEALNNKLQQAQEQTQSIAHKALETAAQRSIYISPNEISNKA
ncbi:MAG: hypothetical protein K2X04_03335 [Burkholderiales bacterium]|nr:hypothetical protein [Burkholderiales bacterium]